MQLKQLSIRIRKSSSWRDVEKRDTKTKGNIGELAVIFNLIQNGWKIAIPYGDSEPFDILIYKNKIENLKRVQVKYRESKNGVLRVGIRTISNGKVSKVYNSKIIDIIATYDATTSRCFYIPSNYFDNFKSEIALSYKPRQPQQVDIEQFSRMVE